MLGFLAASPLAAIHPAVPVIVYSALAFVSVLIVTATPFSAIPRRIRGAYEHLMGVDLMDAGAQHDDSHDRSYLYENEAAAEPKKKRRKRLFGKDHDDDLPEVRRGAARPLLDELRHRPVEQLVAVGPRLEDVVGDLTACHRAEHG